MTFSVTFPGTYTVVIGDNFRLPARALSRQSPMSPPSPLFKTYYTLCNHITSVRIYGFSENHFVQLVLAYQILPACFEARKLPGNAKLPDTELGKSVDELRCLFNSQYSFFYNVAPLML